jgi:type IV secretion system protein VirD4
MTRRESLPVMFVAGFAGVWLLTVSTAIGWWEYDALEALGEPAYRSRFFTAYWPWEAARWWWLWRHDPDFMAHFWEGAENAVYFSALFSLFCLHMVRSYGPLPHVEEEEQPHRWGTVDDLLASKRISATAPGIVLGRHGNTVIRHVGDDHILVLGASRTGEKTTSIVLPSIADSTTDSLIVFDPKAEILAAVGDECAKRGDVFCLDPTRPGSHAFNPLLEIRDGERCIGDCRLLGLLLTGDAKGREPFWSMKAADLISALIRVVCIDGGPRTFERVRSLGLGVASGKAPPTTDQYARELIGAHMAMEWRPRSGVDAQVQLALSFAADPVVCNATQRCDFSVADICAGPRPVAVFVTLPAAQSEALRNLARTFVQAILLGLMHDRKFASDGREKTRRTTILLEEFPQLGSLPLLENGLAVMAGYSAKAVCVCQSVEQIREAYGPNQSIVGNMGTIAWCPSFSKDSYESLTAAAGTLVAAMRARHRKLGVIDRPSETVSQSRAPVLNPRELQRRSRDEFLVFHAGADPTWLQKARYWEMSAYAGRIKSIEPSFR